MTRCAVLVLVLVLAACGGSSPKTAPVPGVGSATGETPDPIPTTKGPDCAVVADKLATVVHADTPDHQAEARDELRIRCTDDRWSDEARSCFGTAETDDEVDGCAKHLTDAQRGQLGMKEKKEAKKGKAMSPRGGAGGDGTPPPPPPPRGTTRGRGQKASSDPCEGGEAKADPCEGGERK